MNLTVIVLAAGQGTRMKSALPKVLHPLAGRPMVCHVVDAARSLEPTTLVAVVGWGAEQVRRALGPEVVYVTQAEQLGPGHALQQAAEVAAGRAGTVLVLYGNIPLLRPETLKQAVAHHQVQDAAVTILTFRSEGHNGYSRIVRDVATGRVQAIVEEEKAGAGQREIEQMGNGLFCFQDEWLWPALARLERRPGGEYCLTDLVARACQQGERVAALCLTDPLEGRGVAHRLDLVQAESEMRRRINERWLLAGVTLVHPETTYIEAGVEIGADTVIWPNSFLRGQTRIGRGCTIGPGAVIADSTIGDGCRVELSVVEQAIMEEGSNVGPFGHLRKGAHLGAGAHMGNFGEIKNSYLGPGAKMGHFSYLGDATVGAGANIGAGTITCNYDGQRKHPTVIGKGAFIGSDTMLVAPVTVGDGAKTGAGSVVTHDVPPGEVVYGVPARARPVAVEGKAEEKRT